MAAEAGSREYVVVLAEQLPPDGADVPVAAIIVNAEAVGHHIAAAQPNTAVYTAAVHLDRYDAQLGALVGRARALIVVVHPDLAVNAGLAYATLLQPGAALLLVESPEFGPGWPMGRGVFEHGILTDLEQGTGIRCAFLLAAFARPGLRSASTLRNAAGLQEPGFIAIPQFAALLRAASCTNGTARAGGHG